LCAPYHNSLLSIPATFMSQSPSPSDSGGGSKHEVDKLAADEQQELIIGTIKQDGSPQQLKVRISSRRSTDEATSYAGKSTI
ncbi:MAG: hypothetical protein L0H75_11595, partial [Nitrosospira sp.]|nr:hypothetical protein [Nitrosospira sp.]